MLRKIDNKGFEFADRFRDWRDKHVEPYMGPFFIITILCMVFGTVAIRLSNPVLQEPVRQVAQKVLMVIAYGPVTVLILYGLVLVAVECIWPADLPGA